MRRARLFFALWPNEEEAEATAETARLFLAGAGGRPVAKERLHMTLLFLGAVAVDLIDSVDDAAQALSQSRFSLELDRLGCWRRAQVAWLAPSSPPAAAMELAAALRLAAGSVGIGLESRRFRPHVTLARRVSKPIPGRSVTSLRWQINGFGLYQSVTHAAGPEYRCLRQYPLVDA